MKKTTLAWQIVPRWGKCSTKKARRITAKKIKSNFFFRKKLFHDEKLFHDLQNTCDNRAGPG